MEKIEALAGDPFPSGAVKLTDSESLYRIRVGDYRVVYGIDAKARSIYIHYIRHRKEAYR